MPKSASGGCLLWGDLLLGGGLLPGGVSARGGVWSGGVWSGGGLLPGGGIPACTEVDTPPMDRITDACKNFTLAQLHCGR